ncbi:MAG: 16S rRNA (adenine(1518)-N(6)/adenine(1519)-N(6))-dimethyltransferase RsmA [Candidatus Bathyarchaeia archaeon]
MAHKIWPRKRLGQNFLVNEETLDKIVSYASPNKDDVVLEVGAGLGFLTERLAKTFKEVIAVEVDPRLVRILMRRLNGYRNVIILGGDILKMESLPPFNKVVSIPPYSISSPLIFWLLKRRFDCAVLTFQEEFGRRLVAQPGTRDYGRLTVTVYYYADVDLLDFIPKEFFWPMPEVSSVIVRLRPRKPPFFVENEDLFFNFIRAVFTQKNKKLRNAITVFFNSINISKNAHTQLIDSIPFHYRRVKEMSPEELSLVFNDLIKRLYKADRHFPIRSS